MNKTLLILLSFIGLIACHQKKESSEETQFINQIVQHTDSQLWRQIECAESKGVDAQGRWLIPRTVTNDSLRNIVYIPIDDWTSGFFAGTLWYQYELSNDKKWLTWAKKYTEQLDSIKLLKWHHDVGFMIGCSYGNGYRLTNQSGYKEVLVEAAKSLSTRYRPAAGVIQSWDVAGWQATRGWECPVIIDNMMNLELLFNATQLTGDSAYWKIAVSHANITLKNHFRPDHSCYHVVDYSLKDGSVRNRHTAQGLAHESAWSRGLAWAIYGYTVCYRYTKNPIYLEQARKTFDYYWNSPYLPSDKIALWDFQASQYPATRDKSFRYWKNPNLDKQYNIRKLRDASASAIIASALYEISTYNLPHYRKNADQILASLTSPNYLAAVGTNQNFLLMHSVGSVPHSGEIDVPINYADYYFLEALKRKKEEIKQ